MRHSSFIADNKGTGCCEYVQVRRGARREESNSPMAIRTLRAGRWTKEDLVWLKSIIDEVIDTFDELREVQFVEGEFKGGIARNDDINDLSDLYGLATPKGSDEKNE